MCPIVLKKFRSVQKKHTLPPSLQVKWLFPKSFVFGCDIKVKSTCDVLSSHSVLAQYVINFCGLLMFIRPVRGNSAVNINFCSYWPNSDPYNSVFRYVSRF